MSIDLSRVNVSLQQFQSISSGKYNAGEVKLASETTLGKVNNHVHLTGSNATPLSHAEVLAVKNAFVKALSSNGVDANVMSLLVQQSSSAVIEMPATALDPEGKRAPFSYGGNGGGLTRSFRLERDAAGGITVRFETTVRPTNLIVGGDAITLGAGSSISGSYALTLSAEKLNTLGGLDFANCDNTAAEQAMNGNGEQKLRTAVNRLPPDFRFDLTPTTTFSAVLN